MANPDDYLYEYAVIRYVPRIDRGEFLNVGLIMMCKRQRWIHAEICLDEQRLRALDPTLDLERLSRQLQIFTLQNVPQPGLPVEERYRWLTAAKSAILQTSPSHPGIALPSTSDEPPTTTLQTEFTRLLNQLVR